MLRLLVLENLMLMRVEQFATAFRRIGFAIVLCRVEHLLWLLQYCSCIVITCECMTGSLNFLNVLAHKENGVEDLGRLRSLGI